MIGKFDNFITMVKEWPEELRTAFLVKRVKYLNHSEEYTDNEIRTHCSVVIEIVVSVVNESISPFIASRSLGFEIEEQLISSLLDKAKWYTWLNLAAFGGIDDGFFDRLEDSEKKFKAKVTSMWFQRIEESICRSDAREALKYINEVMFQVKVVERRLNVLGEGIPDDLPHLKGFFSDCHEYLLTRTQLEAPATSGEVADCTNKKLLVAGEVLTHREEALAYEYRQKIKEVPALTREEMRKHGKKREQAFDSINTASATYKPAREKELKKVIDALKDSPSAQKLAVNDLDRLQNS